VALGQKVVAALEQLVRGLAVAGRGVIGGRVIVIGGGLVGTVILRAHAPNGGTEPPTARGNVCGHTSGDTMELLKIRRVGNSRGVVLPKSLLEELALAEGDQLFVTKTPDGLLLSPYDPDFARGVELFEEGRRQYRTALHELAK
jgi:putative addiction module antidote